MSELDILKEKVIKLKKLLDDPHPGLLTWCEAFSKLREDVGTNFISLDQAIAEAEKSQWFTTTAPLSDGDYVWRLNKDSTNRFLLSVRHNVLWYGDAIHDWKQYYKGEWCLIEFPD